MGSGGYEKFCSVGGEWYLVGRTGVWVGKTAVVICGFVKECFEEIAASRALI